MSSMIRARWLQRWHCSESVLEDTFSMKLPDQISSGDQKRRIDRRPLDWRQCGASMIYDVEHSGDTLMTSAHLRSFLPVRKRRAYFHFLEEAFCGVLLET